MRELIGKYSRISIYPDMDHMEYAATVVKQGETTRYMGYGDTPNEALERADLHAQGIPVPIGRLGGKKDEWMTNNEKVEGAPLLTD